MAGKSRALHELIPVCRNGKAYVYRTKWHYLGKWEGDGPSAESVERLNRLKGLWATDPGAKAKVVSGLLLIELWRAWEASPESPTSGSRDDFERVERYLFGRKSAPGPHAQTLLADFMARDLRAWQSLLCGLKNPDGSLRMSRDTVRRCVSHVRKCFAWGVVEGKVDQLHAAALSLVEPPAKGKVKEAGTRTSIDKAVSDKVLSHLSPPLRAVIELLWLTSARPSEILGLKSEDIQRTGTILLRGGAKLELEAGGVWAAVLDKHKTVDKGFERVIFFGPRSQVLLAPYLDRPGYLFRPAEGRRYQDGCELKAGPVRKASEVVRWKPGEFYKSHTLLKAVSRACKRAGVTGYSPYQIRHSASAAIMDEHGTEAAGVFMGHRPRGVTGGYVGANLRLAAKVAREVG